MCLHVCLCTCLVCACLQIPTVHELAERLRHVHIRAADDVFWSPTETYTQPGTLEEAAELRAGLALLRALPCRPQNLVIEDWRASEQVVIELGALAHMGDTLSELDGIGFHREGIPAAEPTQSEPMSEAGVDNGPGSKGEPSKSESAPSERELSESESSKSKSESAGSQSESEWSENYPSESYWSESELEEGEIRKGDVSDDGALEEGELHAWELEPLAQLPALVQSLPAPTWHVYVPSLSIREVEAFVRGAPRNRTAERPLTIVVHGMMESWGVWMNAELERTGPYPHVTVEVRNGAGEVDSDSDSDEDW